jgi:hypothetical protein
MAKIMKERVTAIADDDFVVFLIGMRINNIWAVHRWLPVFSAMGRMLPELFKNPQLGFKSYQMWFGRTLILVQYWQSSEHLLSYAKATDAEHLPAWRAFNKAARSTTAVGIYHETYLIGAGKTENIYVNMPPFGFGKVGRLEPVAGKRNTAQGRLKTTKDN